MSESLYERQSWNRMVNMTKVELLIPDPEMYFCFEIGMRGGFTYNF